MDKQLRLPDEEIKELTGHTTSYEPKDSQIAYSLREVRKIADAQIAKCQAHYASLSDVREEVAQFVASTPICQGVDEATWISEMDAEKTTDQILSLIMGSIVERVRGMEDELAQLLYDQYRDVDGKYVKSIPLDKDKNHAMWKEMGIRANQAIQVVIKEIGGETNTPKA